jgi:Mg2+-importing ATPase
MLSFGPLSSLFDFATFAILLWVFHAGPELFRSGWFVESLATQTLVIFAIRTRRSPFWRSAPSAPLMVAALTVVAVGAALPATPLGPILGFAPVPTALYVTLTVLAITYLLLVEAYKRFFFRRPPTPTVVPLLAAGVRHLRRRTHRFSHP